MKKEEITEVLITYFKDEIKNKVINKDGKIFVTLKNKTACIDVQPL